MHFVVKNREILTGEKIVNSLINSALVIFIKEKHAQHHYAIIKKRKNNKYEKHCQRDYC